jgi:hypothetical protein
MSLPLNWVDVIPRIAVAAALVVVVVVDTSVSCLFVFI